MSCMYVCIGELHVDLAARVQSLSLSEASCADVVVIAAAGGDLNTLTSYLKQHPEHVRLEIYMYMYIVACGMQTL